MSHIIKRPILTLRLAPQAWRNRVGLGVTHMLSRKAKALRMTFHHGFAVGKPKESAHGAKRSKGNE